MLSPGVGRRLSMLLAPAEQALRARQRSALQELEHTLVRMDASEADTTTLRESITVLDSLFLCCVLGEFNAGKSALLNALLGGDHCGEGVLPTTAAITLIKHPSVPFEPSHAQSEVEVLDIPRSWLRGLHLVDTPGTNSIEDAHTALTQVANPDPNPNPNPNPDPNPNPSPNPNPNQDMRRMAPRALVALLARFTGLGGALPDALPDEATRRCTPSRSRHETTRSPQAPG